MKITLSKQQIERAYNEINKCSCCGITPEEARKQHPFDGSHICGCNPEVFRQEKKEEIEIEI